MAAPTKCPKCGGNIEVTAELTHVGWVQSENDPEGKARLDLVLECYRCDTQFNAFVPLAAFVEIE